MQKANAKTKNHPPRRDREGKTAHNNAQVAPRHVPCRCGVSPKWVLKPGRQFNRGCGKTNFDFGLLFWSTFVLSQPAFIARYGRGLRGYGAHSGRVLARRPRFQSPLQPALRWETW